MARVREKGRSMMAAWRGVGRASRAVLATLAVALLANAGHDRARAQQTSGPEPRREVSGRGQSATLLPDGRWLLIGGTDTRSVVAIQDLSSGRVTVLPSHPSTPRAWHSATLLSDGTVLIVGGTDVNGRTVTAPERFIPSTQSFEGLPDVGFAPRARHTATLLTDGRVLIVGGTFGGPRDDAEIWDPVAETARAVGTGLQQARTGHTATLLGDGRVLFAGGTVSDGRSEMEVFDPASARFEQMTAPVRDAREPFVTATTPTGSARDVTPETAVAVRFSRALDVLSVTAVTARIAGPDGDVTVVPVPAEAGRLLFLNLVAPLKPASTYTVVLHGLTGVDGHVVRDASWSFTTKAAASDVAAQRDAEDMWDPTRSSGWRVDGGRSPWQRLPALMAPPGVTALAGQVLRLDGRPLAHVTLTIDGRDTRTNDSGRFLLLLPGVAGGRHQLGIEGMSANRPGRTYGFFEAGLTIASGVTNVLPYTIWMPRLDTTHRVTIPSPTIAETVVTTPFIPGLELHLPAGSVVKDEAGRIVREIGITPIPVDRPPFPLPKNVEVPIYFTIQPGGAYVSNVRATGPKGAQLVYPNYRHTATGVIANFWHYDPDVRDWYVYGPGVVKGSQVFPDARTRIYEFTGAMINDGQTPPAWWPSGLWWPGGDPVDVSTGMFVHHTTDLLLPDVVPLSLRRTYRPADPATRPFGKGTTHEYAMFLWSAHQYSEADLILPDGARIHYVRTSAGSGWTDAIFEHTTSPTRFSGSRITWNGQGWNLRLRDGTVYVFGENAPLQAIRDRFGNTIEVQHANGQSGNITRVVSPNGRWLEFSYDGSNRITQAKDNSGRTVGYQYDGSGRLWKVTDAAGGVTEYGYDTSDRLVTVKDPRTILYLTNQYDSNDRIIQQTQADSTTFQFSYTLSGGNVIQTAVTDPRGHVTTFSFNTSGYPTSRVQAVGLTEERTTTYTRDATSQRVMSTVDPLGRQTDYTYDARGNLTSITRLAGTGNATTTSFAYESSFDQVATITDPLNRATSFAYDAKGRLTTITDPLSHQTVLTYNEAGRPLTVANHLNETVTLAYDHGDLVSITNPLGYTTTRFIDAAGRVVRITNPAGRSRRYTYDAMNQLTSTTDALGNQTAFTYDDNGNVLTVTDGRSNTTTWTYDSMNRVATRTDPLSRTESYTYDANGNLSQIVDRKNQTRTYAYDALDRVTLTTYSDSSTTACTYDDADRTTQIADSVGGTITRAYDDLDRLTSETTPEGTVSYTFDAAGRRATLDVTGQSQIAYTYDDADRVTAITQGSNTVSAAYDAANRRTSLTLPNGIVTEYAYDAASQVTSHTYKRAGTTIGTLTHSYDENGRRTGLGGSWARTSLPPSLGSATYDAANQVVSWGSTMVSYDANGSLTSDGTNTYTWNARNQLASASGAATASFAYDGRGRRRSKTIGGIATGFLYDRVNLVQERSGGSASANVVAGLSVDEYFTRTDSTTTRHYLTDGIGSSIALTDSSGTVQAEYTYEPFGGTSVSGSATTNATGFTGRELDQTGLHYYRSRYYQSAFQRFVSEDPIGFAGGINPYVYVLNAPTTYVDPFGLKPRRPNGGGGGSGAGSGSRAGAAAGSGGGDSGAGGDDPSECNGPSPWARGLFGAYSMGDGAAMGTTGVVVMSASGVASVELAAAGPLGWGLIAVGSAPVMVGGAVLVEGGAAEVAHGATDVAEAVHQGWTCR